MLNKEFYDNLDLLAEKYSFDIEKSLPEQASSYVNITALGPEKFVAKVRIKGVGKTVSVKEMGDDCEHTLLTAKRKALAKAQGQLRKKRGRWIRDYYCENIYSSTAS